MSDMSHNGFRDACDRLSQKVDAENFERFRWGRDEAPKLIKLVTLVKGAVDDRTDIEINEEGGEQNLKRFVIKVHGKRIAGLSAGLRDGHAFLTIGTIERSPFTVADGEPLHTEFSNMDEQWVADTIGKLMERIGG